MPRPKKCRSVCKLPKNNFFIPSGENINKKKLITMTVEEYETIRLIDYQGFTQEECSKYMNVARTTVQQIYNDARKKLSQAIVEGTCLKIDGGNYTLCEGKEAFCNCGGCRKHRLNMKTLL